MALQISGLSPQKVGIRTPQSFLEQCLFAIAKKLGVDKFVGIAPQVVPYSIDFSSLSSPQYVNLSSDQFKNRIGVIKSIFVDNSDNLSSVTITEVVSRQQIIIPAGYQGYTPIASTSQQFEIDTSGDTIVGFDFFNVDISPAIWSAEPSTTVIGSVLMAGSAGVDHSANEPAYPPVGLTLLASVSANTSRAEIGVQSQDADQIQVFMVHTGGTVSRLLLESGGGNNVGGGAWSSQTFKGALAVYGEAGGIVAVYEN